MPKIRGYQIQRNNKSLNLIPNKPMVNKVKRNSVTCYAISAAKKDIFRNSVNQSSRNLNQNSNQDPGKHGY